MSDDDIRVNWRAAILLDSGSQIVLGRLKRLGRSKAIVRADRNLKPGCRCDLALMLPKSNPDEPDRIVEGRGVVVHSILSSMQFLITLERIELEGNGAAMVDEQIRRYGMVWSR